MPSRARKRPRRRLARALATLAALAALAPAAAAAATVDVFPSAGTLTASRSTQISFRGIDPSKLTGVSVSGSSSGPHSGRFRAHPDGHGASFFPDKPFAAGELVTVRAGQPLTGASGGAVTFTIARHPSLSRIRKGRGTVDVDPEGRPREALRFHTRKDLRPPALKVIQRSEDASTDSIFVGPKAGPGQNGVAIYDDLGRLRWFKRIKPPYSPYDFRAQTYDGQPVLTWWQGRISGGKGRGVGVILDRSYNLVSRVHAGNGYSMDQHEFELTPRGTAYINVYEPVKFDTSSVGGSKRGIAWDSIVQEVDIKTGLVLFEWHSLDHIALSESYFAGKGTLPYDSFHVNSVSEEGDGSLLLSGRNANLLCDVDRHSGAIRWRLGGKDSDFKMRSGTRMTGQHQAVWQGDGTISVFDNGGSRQAPVVPDHESRGVVLGVNQTKKTVRLVREYRHRYPPLFSRSQGSLQLLPGGAAFLSWGGGNPYLTEFSAGGERTFEAHFLPSGDDTYRAYRLPWKGARPPTPPDVAAFATSRGTNVYPSWNGATDVATWEVLAGDKPGSLKPAGSGPWLDFETRVSIRGEPRYLAVRGLDAGGKVLGTSKTIQPRRVG